MNKTFIISFALILLCLGINFCKPIKTSLETAGFTSEDIKLTIFYPSTGSLRALIELRKQGLIPLEKLKVLGVYHEKERMDYKRSMKLVQENNIDWIAFHKLSGEISKNNLFQKNSLTEEFQEIFKNSDGIIFFGGADIPPYLYNERTSLLTQIATPYRHFLELSFVFHLLGGFQNEDFTAFLNAEPQFPVLGICLGSQSLNIGTGGTMVQDIPSEIHGADTFEDVIAMDRENWHLNPLARLYPEKNLFPYSMHPIKLLKNGKFVQEFGFKKEDQPYILSAHHQMAGDLGKGLKVIATSLDEKVVEAIAHERFPNVLGVQFHPEFPILWVSSQTFKMDSTDEEEFNLPDILKNNPPSLAFHKNIWAWFSEKIEQHHTRKQANIKE